MARKRANLAAGLAAVKAEAEPEKNAEAAPEDAGAEPEKSAKAEEAG